MQNPMRAQQRLRTAGFPIAADGDFGKHSFSALIRHIAKRKDERYLDLALGQAMKDHFPAFEMFTELRMAHALAQQCAESGGFGRLVESLNYSAKGLRNTFSKSRISDADCLRLGRPAGVNTPVSREKQEEIANIVYGGQFGRDELGNTQLGDGWKFRGRGIKQLTGRYNYTKFRDETGIDVVSNPELLEQADPGVHAACSFWRAKNLNSIADSGASSSIVRAVTIRINGGTNGLSQRQAAFDRARAILL